LLFLQTLNDEEQVLFIYIYIMHTCLQDDEPASIFIMPLFLERPPKDTSFGAPRSDHKVEQCRTHDLCANHFYSLV
jgi:hypothetical protein